MEQLGCEMEKRYYIGEFAKLIGKSVKTLQRWDRNGRLTAKRDLADNRYYTDADLRSFKDGEENISDNQIKDIVKMLRKELCDCDINLTKRDLHFFVRGICYSRYLNADLLLERLQLELSDLIV